MRLVSSIERRANAWALLILPAVLFLVIFFLWPLLSMTYTSLTDPSPANYLVFAQSGLYAKVLIRTLVISFVVMVTCLVLGYPYAYLMHHAGRQMTAVLVALVLLPFWTSLLVRTYAWTVLLQDTGIINDVLRAVGLIDQPLQLMRNLLGVTIGMTHVLLPFMVLPIYAVMRRIDPDLVSAAGNLGASPLTAFRKVFLPLSLPGVFAGSLLVFVLAVGFYITPALLGSPQQAMFSELVAIQFQQVLDFGRGSALSVVLLGVTLVLLGIGTRIVRIGRALGYEVK